MENNETNMWLSRIDQYFADHNAFHKKIKAGIKEFDRWLISDPAQFKADLEKWINEVHEDFKRCAPMWIEDGWGNGSPPNWKDIYWRIGSGSACIVSINIFHVQGIVMKAKAPEEAAQTFDKPAIIASNAIWDTDSIDIDPYAP